MHRHLPDDNIFSIQRSRGLLDMSVGRTKVERRREAERRLSEVVGNPDHTIVIHYSCESFYDRPSGASPRITSIAVRNLGSGQSTSFSIHQMAEREHDNLEQLEEHYDELESKMMAEFYNYVKSRGAEIWLHWNMRSIQYGFEAIAHRFRVLNGTPEDIPEAKRFDLARHLHVIYGDGYIDHPHLLRLVEKNDLKHPQFLDGPGEADAFNRREYVRLHQSTLTKVDVIAHIAERTYDGKLKTNSRPWERHSGYGQWIGETVSDAWWIILPLTACSLLANVLQILGFFRPTP